MNLSTSVMEIPRVGPAYLRRLDRLNIKTIGQLIFHFPHRYEDFSNLVPVSNIPDEGGPAFAKASAGKPFCVQGQIISIRSFRAFRRKMMLTQATIEDETGKIKALWFNQPYLTNTLKKGTFVCLAGKVKGKKSAKYFSSPAYEKLPDNYKEASFDLNHTGGLIPIYPETEGLSSKWLRFVIKPILTQLQNRIPDSLPEKIVKKYNFLPVKKALWQIHFPQTMKLAEEAKKRFGFEELFNLSIFVLRERLKLAKENARSVAIKLELIKKFTANLPFKLTDAQKKSAWQILKDMEKPRPMNRLLEGDVGSGKTVVAALAALNAVKAGYQVAFLAPTEILAKQHYKTISSLLEKFDIKIGLMTGKSSSVKTSVDERKLTRRELVKKCAIGEIDILIGTHAIIQDYYPSTPEKTPVQFNKLALLVIDEQHRFGTEQRAKLCRPSANATGGQKDYMPHLLSMTATPIPRTLSLTVYGDLDLSVIDELPKGRKKIITKVIQPKNKKATYEFIRQQVKEGRQAFVICPRIEPPKISEEDLERGIFDQRNMSWMDVKAVKQEYKKLTEDIFPDLKIGMLHGKMRSQEKETVMQEFKSKIIDILVSTSVVEVGVDIPNATVMMIEGSEKFGLAQLHQFRGRVGRSDFQSYCFLFTDAPGLITNRRLKALVNCDNGFELAEKDLAIRGPGDFTGQRQWGIPDLAMASLTDTILVSKARNDAKEILTQDPELKKYPLLKEKIREYKTRIHLE
jgi:ATP-dependent DNA helicase RecG